MTNRQRIFLMAELWPAACEYRGWHSEDRELRMEVLSAAVQRPLASASEISTTDDFDRVRRHLEALAGKLKQHDGRAARYREKFRRQLRCLALYVEDAAGYAKAIIRDKFHRAGTDPVGFAEADARRLAEWLSADPIARFDRRAGKLVEGPSQLEQLVMTLDERLHNAATGLRVKAGHTLHDMLTAAGLQCSCKDCARRFVTLPAATVQPEPEGELVHAGGEEEPF